MHLLERYALMAIIPPKLFNLAGPEVEDFVDTICKAFWSRAGYWPEECQAIHGRLSSGTGNL